MPLIVSLRYHLFQELGTWFIVYGFIRNIPHYFFLSFIGAELFTRVLYDPLIAPRCRTQQNRLPPAAEDAEDDEAKFAMKYAYKVYKHAIKQQKRRLSMNSAQENVVKRYIRKILAKIYTPAKNYCPYTNIVVCTYSVAAVFLYYLACSFTFFYVARTTSHLIPIRTFIEQLFNLGKLISSLSFNPLSASARII